MIDLGNLNSEQKLAVSTLHGPVLCIAGAGSGKTTTLTYRVANLIDKGINPASILLLTFTRKAANDMLQRVKNLVGELGKQVEGGTFHHFAAITISKYCERLNLNKNFSVLDDNDSVEILQSLKDSRNNELKDFNIRLNKNLIFQIISKARNHSKSIKEIIDLYYANLDTEYKAIERLYSIYSEYKQGNNLLDYDDLLEYLYKLLLMPDIRNLICEQYKYVMVDEYQDTNLIQAKITQLLSNNENIMVVGDDSQSIYSFRGSRIDNILEFNQLFPKCKIIKLEKNYRSCGYILNGCNSLINKSLKSIKKELFTDKPDGNKIILVKCLSEKEEANLVAHRILQLYNSGCSLNDMAVLFRNSNFSFELEVELAKRCIPYKKIGGARIFDSFHIRDIISYLRVLNNPYDKVSWLRILMLIKGIGIQSATSIYTQITNQLEPYDLSKIKIKSDIRKELNKLSKMLLNSAKYISKEPILLINIILDYYLPVLKAKNLDNFSDNIKDLDQFTLIAEKYHTLHDLLSEIFIDTEFDKPQKQSDNNSMHLTLSTIHSAKGLEWKQVFIISALEGRFPSKNSINNKDDLEEERRLMYVAMTRAMEGLTISYPSGIWDKSSHEFLSMPSRFIKEISKDNIEVWQIKH